LPNPVTHRGGVLGGFVSVANFIVHIISGLVAYSFLPTKPSLIILPFSDLAIVA
jgi:hypothetical protein